MLFLEGKVGPFIKRCQGVKTRIFCVSAANCDVCTTYVPRNDHFLPIFPTLAGKDCEAEIIPKILLQVLIPTVIPTVNCLHHGLLSKRNRQVQLLQNYSILKYVF